MNPTEVVFTISGAECVEYTITAIDKDTIAFYPITHDVLDDIIYYLKTHYTTWDGRSIQDKFFSGMFRPEINGIPCKYYTLQVVTDRPHTETTIDVLHDIFEHFSKFAPKKEDEQ